MAAHSCQATTRAALAELLELHAPEILEEQRPAFVSGILAESATVVELLMKRPELLRSRAAYFGFASAREAVSDKAPAPIQSATEIAYLSRPDVEERSHENHLHAADSPFLHEAATRVHGRYGDKVMTSRAGGRGRETVVIIGDSVLKTNGRGSAHFARARGKCRTRV